MVIKKEGTLIDNGSMTSSHVGPTGEDEDDEDDEEEEEEEGESEGVDDDTVDDEEDDGEPTTVKLARWGGQEATGGTPEGCVQTQTESPSAMSLTDEDKHDGRHPVKLNGHGPSTAYFFENTITAPTCSQQLPQTHMMAPYSFYSQFAPGAPTPATAATTQYSVMPQISQHPSLTQQHHHTNPHVMAATTHPIYMTVAVPDSLEAVMGTKVGPGGAFQFASHHQQQAALGLDAGGRLAVSTTAIPVATPPVTLSADHAISSVASQRQQLVGSLMPFGTHSAPAQLDLLSSFSVQSKKYTIESFADL